MSSKHRKQRTAWLAKRVFHYILLGIYKISYGLYIRTRYRVKLTENSDDTIKGPYLLLSNHCNNYDGVFLQAIMSKPINFVVTDSVFKNRALGGLLSSVGYIPKKKFVSDIRAIKQIMRTAQNGGIIGIFPEGRRSWDGKTVHISTPTYKLIKKLNLPVVTAKIKGSYLSEPRWANTKRYGMIEIERKTLLSVDDIKGMNEAEIEAKIITALDHNEFEWQDDRKIPFKGKSLAEGFERLLFICPECKGIDTLRSSGSKVHCSSCDAEYYLDQYGYIHSNKGFLPTENIIDLNKWQMEKFKQSLSLLKENNDIFLQDEGASLLSTTSINEPYKEVETGILSLTRTELCIGNLKFNLSDVYGVSINFKTHLNFRHKSRDYRVAFSNKNISLYKWFNAVRLITGDKKEAF